MSGEAEIALKLVDSNISYIRINPKAPEEYQLTKQFKNNVRALVRSVMANRTINLQTLSASIAMQVGAVLAEKGSDTTKEAPDNSQPRRCSPRRSLDKQILELVMEGVDQVRQS